MYKFEIKDLIEGSSSLEAYEQGIKFYRMNRIHSLEVFEERECIFAKVDDTFRHEVEIYLSNGHLHSTYCNCEKFQSSRGYCRHIVAVLTSLKMSERQTEASEKIESYPLTDFIDYYIDKDMASESDKVNIRVEYSISLDTYYQQSTVALRLGVGQLYVLKNPEEFFDAIRENKEYEFGKKFTFDPYGHSFNENDKLILDTINNIVDDQKYYNSGKFSYNKSNVIKGKEIPLTNRDLRTIIACLDGQEIDLIINDNPKKAKILHEDISLGMIYYLFLRLLIKM